jgi:hypothetical protein
LVFQNRKIKFQQNLSTVQLKVVAGKIKNLKDLISANKPSEENYESLQENYITDCKICPGCKSDCLKKNFGGYNLLSVSDWKKLYDNNCILCAVKKYLSSDIGKSVLNTVFNKLINERLMKAVGRYVPDTILSRYCTIISNPATPIDDPTFGFERIFGKTKEDQEKTLKEFLSRAKNELLMYLLEQIPTLGNYITSDNDIITTIRNEIFKAIDTVIFDQDFVKKMIKYLRRGLAFYLSRDDSMKDLYTSWCKPPKFRAWDAEIEKRAQKLEQKAQEDVKELDASDI